MGRMADGILPKRTGEEEGQALAEYAMILLFVAVACVAAVTLLGIPIQGFYVAFNRSF
jgi:Flp pilus assembly pilin Flp